MTKWTALEIPSQAGRSAVVTGTGGLGYEDALELARAGADVILAGRNRQKGEASVARVRAEIPNARIAFEQLDLASLSSVEAFATRLSETRESLDLLINNAGVMVPPALERTSGGFELQFGTNYLGHFALTARLLPLLQKGTDPRVVSLSSVAARDGSIDFANLNAETGYAPMLAYSQSKLACLMFAFEFQRRSVAGQWGVISIAAHPGVSRTDLLHNGPGSRSPIGIARSLFGFLLQSAAQGALPTLYAATAQEAKPGGYYGPDKLNEIRGHPAPSKIPPRANDLSVAKQLWDTSERLSGVQFP